MQVEEFNKCKDVEKELMNKYGAYPISTGATFSKNKIYEESESEE